MSSKLPRNIVWDLSLALINEPIDLLSAEHDSSTNLVVHDATFSH